MHLLVYPVADDVPLQLNEIDKNERWCSMTLMTAAWSVLVVENEHLFTVETHTDPMPFLTTRLGDANSSLSGDIKCHEMFATVVVIKKLSIRTYRLNLSEPGGL